MILDAGKIRLFGSRAEVLAAVARPVINSDGRAADQGTGSQSRTSPVPSQEGATPRDRLTPPCGSLEQHAV
jgi:hypothetical protein